MLIPAFKLELNNPILRGLVHRSPSFTITLIALNVDMCGARLLWGPTMGTTHHSPVRHQSAGKIFFHSPNEKDLAHQIRFLNINRKISALACGKLSTKLSRDVLLVGAQVTQP